VQEALGWLLAHATPTWTWPEAVHPTRGGGVDGAPHDPVATAELLLLVRELLVLEVGPEGLALCVHWPEAWLGQGLEVHGVPTAHGALSYAVRWHGERPALLWELEPHGAMPDGSPNRPSRPAPRLTAPGLDPSWSSEARAGEALLAAPNAAGSNAAGSNVAGSNVSVRNPTTGEAPAPAPGATADPQQPGSFG
jgi:hypothetical protein